MSSEKLLCKINNRGKSHALMQVNLFDLLTSLFNFNILLKKVKVKFKHNTGAKNASSIMSKGTVITSEGIISDMQKILK